MSGLKRSAEAVSARLHIHHRVIPREKNRARARASCARPLKTRRGYVTVLAVAARSPTTFLYGKDGSEIATTRIWVSMHCGATLLTQSAASRRAVAAAAAEEEDGAALLRSRK